MSTSMMCHLESTVIEKNKMAKILTVSRKSHHPLDGPVFSVHNSENRTVKVKKV